LKRSLRDPASLRSIVDRLNRLTPQHRRKWGRMEISQLMPHLASALRTALGDQTINTTTYRRKGAPNCRKW
jgi:hypothetical protein